MAISSTGSADGRLSGVQERKGAPTIDELMRSAGSVAIFGRSKHVILPQN